jgi:hypothetical protein
MRGKIAPVFLAVILALLSAATVGFAAPVGEPGRPDDPGSNGNHYGQGTSSDANHDPSNPDGTYQGKSGSTPDQDGTGADHGIFNNDKTGPGTDGNNGCGNDPDREDDNNGWCGRTPAPVNGTPAPNVSPAETVSPTETITPAIGAEVLGRTFVRGDTEVAGRNLARTGRDIAQVIIAAMALILLGIGLRTIATTGAR